MSIACTSLELSFPCNRCGFQHVVDLSESGYQGHVSKGFNGSYFETQCRDCHKPITIKLPL